MCSFPLVEIFPLKSSILWGDYLERVAMGHLPVLVKK